jgi:hypothetical protein
LLAARFGRLALEVVGDVGDVVVDHQRQGADAFFELSGGGGAGAAGVGEVGLGEEGCRVVGGEVDGQSGECDLEFVGDRLEGFLRGLQKFEQHAALVVGGDEVVTAFNLRHGPTPFPCSPAPLLPCSPSSAHSVAWMPGMIQRVGGVAGED